MSKRNPTTPFDRQFKPFMTVAEVAKREGVTERMVRNWCVSGKILYAVKYGTGDWMIDLNYMLKRTRVGRPRKKRTVY